MAIGVKQGLGDNWTDVVEGLIYESYRAQELYDANTDIFWTLWKIPRDINVELVTD